MLNTYFHCDTTAAAIPHSDPVQGADASLSRPVVLSKITVYTPQQVSQQGPILQACQPQTNQPILSCEPGASSKKSQPPMNHATDQGFSRTCVTCRCKQRCSSSKHPDKTYNGRDGGREVCPTDGVRCLRGLCPAFNL